MAPPSNDVGTGAGEALPSLRSRKGPATVPTSEKSFTLAEVATHDRPNDCWLIIRSKVYDVTEWVPRHPGGSLIFVKAGRDCTQLFEAYHPLYVRCVSRKGVLHLVAVAVGTSKILGKYYKGEVERSKNDGTWNDVLEYNENSSSEFYPTLKKRVESHFKENKIDPRVAPAMFVKSLLILGGYFACYYAAFFLFQNLYLCLACALGMGFLAAQVGVSIMHDGNHGSYSTWRSFSYLMGASLDLVGASSFMWRQQHVVGHHAFTNVDEFDPDIRVSDPDIRRVTKKQPWQYYHAYQHVYLAALYGLLALKSVFLDDFSAYFKGYIGSVKVARMTPLEFGVFWGGKAFYALYMFLLPALYGRHSGPTFALLYLASQLVTGWTLAFMFQVAHVVEEAQYPEAVRTAEGAGKVAMDWAMAQVATTTDFSPNSWFWLHVSGGLNYQIEHHLFPGVCHVHYPRLAPIVQQTCKEFGVPYHSFPTFWGALAAHFKYLKKVGLSGVELRLDG